ASCPSVSITSGGEGVCAVSAGRGASQPSCGCEFAIISLAASPYDCQSKVAATPIQNAIGKRASKRGRLRTDGAPLGNGRSSVLKSIARKKPSEGSTGNKPAYRE